MDYHIFDGLDFLSDFYTIAAHNQYNSHRLHGHMKLNALSHAVDEFDFFDKKLRCQKCQHYDHRHYFQQSMCQP